MLFLVLWFLDLVDDASWRWRADVSKPPLQFHPGVEHASLGLLGFPSHKPDFGRAEKMAGHLWTWRSAAGKLHHLSYHGRVLPLPDLPS